MTDQVAEQRAKKKREPAVVAAIVAAIATVTAALITGGVVLLSGSLQPKGSGASGANAGTVATSSTTPQGQTSSDQPPASTTSAVRKIQPPDGTSALDLAWGSAYVKATQTVAGTEYKNTLLADRPCLNGTSGSVELDVGYARFWTGVGITDNSPDWGEQAFQVSLNTVVIGKATVKRGEVKTIDVDISRANKGDSLTLAALGNGCPNGTIAWVEPVLVRR